MLELTQRFAFGVLLKKLETLSSQTKACLKEMVINKLSLVTKHLEDLSHRDLSPAQLLEACHYVYEANLIRGSPSRNRRVADLKNHLLVKLPDVLVLRGVPLNPLDAFVVRHILESAGQDGHRFSLDLEDSGIPISGLKALVDLSNINTYRYH